MPSWGPVVGIAVPFGVLAIVFTTIGLVRLRRLRRWRPAEGQVGPPGAFEAPGLPTRFPVFAFLDADGVRHVVASRVRPGPPPGSLVRVRYDPADPSRAMIEGAVQGGAVFLGIGVALGVAGLVAATLATLVRLG